jgi:hypothetical protein
VRGRRRRSKISGVPAVELSAAAVEDLENLIESHELPPDTWDRVTRSLMPLTQFPRVGRILAGPWNGFRFVIGPWSWMVVVYAYLEREDRVVVVTLQDGRSSAAPRPLT